ncbi:MAG: SpoIIE family protein phosphatase [Verrucomicrobiales bacterium]
MIASDECFLFLENGGQRWPCRSGDVIGRAGTVAREVLRHVETLSRRHLQLEKRGPGWYVIVLEETRNTTWMEGKPMQRGVAYPVLGVRTFQVDQFQFYLGTANGMMTQVWTDSAALPASEPGPALSPVPPFLNVSDSGAGPSSLSLEELPGSVIETDVRLHIIAANAGARALLGATPVGRDFDEWAADRTRLRDLLLRLEVGEIAGPSVARFALPAGEQDLEVHASRRTDRIIIQLRNASGEKQQNLVELANRLARRTQVLAEFSVSAAFREGDLAKSLSLLTCQGAELLECSRVSVWLRQPSTPTGSAEKVVSCQAVHDRRTATVRTGAAIDLSYCPSFFDEVAAQNWATASASTPLLGLLREIGFLDSESASALAVALQQGEVFYGVMSFERTAGVSELSETDRWFALCLASFGTAALQACERKEAFARLHESEAHMAAELAEAERYVRRVLPEPIASGPITTEWQMVPSEKVGGDCFGYHWINDDVFAFYILDVVGHGTGAALLSISVLNTLRARLPAAGAALVSPARVLDDLNEAFPMEQQNGMTFTMWFGIYDRRARALTYASGGHPPALLLLGEVPEGQPDYCALATEGPVLGGLPGVQFTEDQVTVPPASKLFLCTDGAFEIPLGSGREWTFEEFIATVRSTRWMDGSETAYLHKRTSALCATPTFPDDFCVVRFSFVS